MDIPALQWLCFFTHFMIEPAGFHNAFESWARELGDESAHAPDVVARRASMVAVLLGQDWAFKGHLSNWLHPGDGGASFKFHEKERSLEAVALAKPAVRTQFMSWLSEFQ